MSAFVGSVLFTSESFDSGRRAALDRQGDYLGTAMRIDDVAFEAVPQRLWVNVTNVGQTTHNASRVTVLVDGVVQPSDQITFTVQGDATSVWPPLTQLSLALDASQLPTRVAVVAPTGAPAFWGA